MLRGQFVWCCNKARSKSIVRMDISTVNRPLTSFFAPSPSLTTHFAQQTLQVRDVPATAPTRLITTAHPTPKSNSLSECSMFHIFNVKVSFPVSKRDLHTRVLWQNRDEHPPLSKLPSTRCSSTFGLQSSKFRMLYIMFPPPPLPQVPKLSSQNICHHSNASTMPMTLSHKGISRLFLVIRRQK